MEVHPPGIIKDGSMKDATFWYHLDPLSWYFIFLMIIPSQFLFFSSSFIQCLNVGVPRGAILAPFLHHWIFFSQMRLVIERPIIRHHPAHWSLYVHPWWLFRALACFWVDSLNLTSYQNPKSFASSCLLHPWPSPCPLMLPVICLSSLSLWLFQTISKLESLLPLPCCDIVNDKLFTLHP